ncbi:protein MIZU-KUSSEI 1 [Lycium barbarum]|uniref:protein MIZU-KUSSEI 1 n=1 Tax=Lycium barbarum TaxID=112863 RepID=UPI00293E2F4B|nr:protein MIZU-KUSSEI 1 [Lycium barbarum]
MTKIDALRRFLLPCFNSTPTSPTPPQLTIHTKKRLSTSLRDDLENKQEKNSPSENQDSSYPTTPTTRTPSATSLSTAPPRSSKTMVIGTIFGQRRGGHVWFCVQHDRLNTKPSLLLELSIPTTTLIQEMKCGLVRIALESSTDHNYELNNCPLHLIPMWTLFCNGRKIGFAVKRRVSQQTRMMLKTMQNMTVGAGVIPSGFVSGQECTTTEEVLYMRANYECIIGGADSESFHLINPDEGPGQEFSIFLLRSK